MDRIDTNTVAEDLFGPGANGFKDGDLPNAIVATRLNAKWFNAVQEELVAVIKGAGLVLNGAVFTQVRQAIDIMVRKQSGACCAAAGTADAITGAFSPTVAALTEGVVLAVRAGATNATTTPSFKADGTALKSIVKGNNLPLVAGDIAGAGHWLSLRYDATLDKWVLLNPAFGVSTGLTVSSSVLAGSAVALTTNTIANVTSITLPPGDWDVSGVVVYVPSGSITSSGLMGSFNTVSSAFDVRYGNRLYFSSNFATDQCLPTPTGRLTLAVTTTVYLICAATFTGGTLAAYGVLSARRIK